MGYLECVDRSYSKLELSWKKSLRGGRHQRSVTSEPLRLAVTALPTPRAEPLSNLSLRLSASSRGMRLDKLAGNNRKDAV